MRSYSKTLHKHFPKYTRSLVGNARNLRRNMTDAERKLWNALRNNQAGVKFRRQVPFGRYILDFYCHHLKLNIELDGSQHLMEEHLKKDKIRDQWLQENGVEVVRFASGDAMRNIDGIGEAILEKIKKLLEKETPPSSSPKRGGYIAPSPLRRG